MAATFEQTLLNDTMTLLSEYSVLSTQYKTAAETYKIQSAKNSATTEKSIYATFPNKKWSGNPAFILPPMSSPVTSKDACNTGCANNSQCTSALFDSAAKTCTLYSSSDTSLITDVSATKSVLINLTNLKKKLHKLSVSISTNLTNSALNTYTSDKAILSNIFNNTKIIADYHILLAENRLIDEAINNYNTADTDYNEQKMFVNQQNITYRYWTIATIILFIIIIKLIFQIDSLTANTIFWTTIFVLVSFALNKASGFAMFGLVVIIFVFKLIKDYFTQ